MRNNKEFASAKFVAEESVGALQCSVYYWARGGALSRK